MKKTSPPARRLDPNADFYTLQEIAAAIRRSYRTVWNRARKPHRAPICVIEDGNNLLVPRAEAIRQGWLILSSAPINPITGNP